MKQQNGFTLVELAIALMVIGLLIGGVLKGQELIENARVTAMLRQVKAYDAAALIFRNTYNALPGDIKRPNRIPNCTTDLCNIGGNGNGKLNLNDTSIFGQEGYNFFPHLTKAGMIQGPEGGTQAEISSDNDLFLATTPFDLSIGTYLFTFYNGSYHGGTMTEVNAYVMPPLDLITSSEAGMIVPVKLMSQIDTKIDDGKPHSGDVQIEAYGDCPSVGYLSGSDENEYAPDDSYNVGGCPLIIKAGF